MNNDITIEKLDSVRERVSSATYAEAKKALTECNGDVIEAIILLESQYGCDTKTHQAKKTIEQVFSKDNEDLKDLKIQIKELLRKSNVIRIIVEKNGKTIMNIPLTVGVVGLALGQVVTLLGLSAAVITKHKIMIQNEDDGSIVDLGELTEEKLTMLKNMLSSAAKEFKDATGEHKKDDKDITDELIKEDEIIVLNKKEQ